MSYKLKKRYRIFAMNFPIMMDIPFDDSEINALRKDQVFRQRYKSLQFTHYQNRFHLSCPRFVLDGDYFSDRLSQRYWKAKSGPFGRGSLPSGKYAVHTFQERKISYESMSRDGIAFSVCLTPLFETHRSQLLIHPDGNIPGTKGCIGIQENIADCKKHLQHVIGDTNHKSSTEYLICHVY